MARFVHTADWQLGKPFTGVTDQYKRVLLQKARIEAVERIAATAKERDVDFVVVAGDLFDSPTADKNVVAEACGAIGHIRVPVYVIPGNHDHGGPGCLWEQQFFLNMSRDHAPNLKVLLNAAPQETDVAILFPCPLLRRLVTSDCTEWLRAPVVFQGFSQTKPRLVLAHGSTQTFTEEDEDGVGGSASSQIALAHLPMDAIDYVALGDWHGTQEVRPKAWYSGTPEYDRFPKGEDYDSGNVLVVEPRRAETPVVEVVHTAALRWRDIPFQFAVDEDVGRLRSTIEGYLGSRTNVDLLRLSLSGSLGLDAHADLDEFRSMLEARLLRLKVDDHGLAVAPTDDEIAALTSQPDDPITASVAQQLVKMTGDGEDGVTAAVALRLLYAAYRKEQQA